MKLVRSQRSVVSVALCALLVALCSPTQAQQPTKVPRIGFLDSSNASGMAVLLDAFRQELSKLGWIEGKNITIEYRFADQKPERLPELAAELVRLKVDLIVVASTPAALAAKSATTTIPIVMTNTGDPHSRQLAELAIKNRFPTMHEASSFVEAGGLMSYASNDTENFRRAAYYVDKILKGVKPSDLPIEQPTKFEFVINLNTAKQIGLTIPPSVLARADKVIK